MSKPYKNAPSKHRIQNAKPQSEWNFIRVGVESSFLPNWQTEVKSFRLNGERAVGAVAFFLLYLFIFCLFIIYMKNVNSDLRSNMGFPFLITEEDWFSNTESRAEGHYCQLQDKSHFREQFAVLFDKIKEFATVTVQPWRWRWSSSCS